MQRQTAYLLGLIPAAQRMISIGGNYTVDDESGIWGMALQYGNQTPRQLTGNIILVCDDTTILDEFIVEARRAGHAVVKSGGENTVIITPAPL